MGILREPEVLVGAPEVEGLLVEASNGLWVCFSGDRSSSGIGLHSTVVNSLSAHLSTLTTQFQHVDIQRQTSLCCLVMQQCWMMML